MESESPPSRTTILGSFLRGRPRNSSQSFTSPDHPRELSPPARRSNNNNNNNNNNLNTPNALQASTSQPQQQSAGLAITQMLRRRRSAGNVNQNQAPAATAAAAGAAVAGASAAAVQHQSTPPPPPQSQTQPHSTTQAALMLAGYTTLLSEGRGGASAGVAPGSAPGATATAAGATVPSNASSPQPNNNTTNTNSLTHRIRLVPHLDSRRSLRFDPIGRDLREGDPALRIGRFTDRSGLGLAAINSLNSNKLAFRSKVVSRAHAEIWVEGGGKFFIRDTKSSSGTFLNHVRLSAANLESRPFQIKDGDVLQLGVDYQGGTEDIYKSVKIRVEIGREWQHGANAFNTNAFKNLKALALPLHNGGPLPGVSSSGKIKSLGIPDCCICLFSVAIRQALFIAPCSHTFHFKCIRPILEAHHPSFSCPLCRTYANLEEDVEVDEASWEIDVSEEDEANNKIGEGENAAGVAGGGPAHDGGEDDRMDVDSDRPAVVFEEPEMESAEAGGGGGGGLNARNGSNHLSPPFEGSGEDDADSDIGANPSHPQHRSPGETYLYTHAVPIPSNGAGITAGAAGTVGGGGGGTNPGGTFVNNTSSAAGLGIGLGGLWGSPGAGSSGSARGDSPVPMNLGGGGGTAAAGQVAVGGGGEDTELGVGVDGVVGIGIDGETMSGKRKR